MFEFDEMLKFIVILSKNAPYMNRFLSAFQVAVLDVDICGPSIPRVMGLEGEQVGYSSS